MSTKVPQELVTYRVQSGLGEVRFDCHHPTVAIDAWQTRTLRTKWMECYPSWVLAVQFVQLNRLKITFSAAEFTKLYIPNQDWPHGQAVAALVLVTEIEEHLKMLAQAAAQ